MLLRASISALWPKISTAIIARVFGVIRFFTDSIEMQKESLSISAKTGTQFQTRIDVAVADIVQVGTITSSPGSSPRAPTAQIKPDVHEFTLMACFTPKCADISRSRLWTCSPPKNDGDQLPTNEERIPFSTTLLATSSSSFPIELYY
jgi:hypothetical protein